MGFYKITTEHKIQMATPLVTYQRGHFANVMHALGELFPEPRKITVERITEAEYIKQTHPEY